MDNLALSQVSGLQANQVVNHQGDLHKTRLENPVDSQAVIRVGSRQANQV